MSKEMVELTNVMHRIIKDSKQYSLFEVIESNKNTSHSFYASGIGVCGNRSKGLYFKRTLARSYLAEEFLNDVEFISEGNYVLRCGTTKYKVAAIRRRRTYSFEKTGYKFSEDMLFDEEYMIETTAHPKQNEVFMVFDADRVTGLSVGRERSVSCTVSKLLYGTNEDTQTPRTIAFTVSFCPEGVVVWGHLYDIARGKIMTTVKLYEGSRDDLNYESYRKIIEPAEEFLNEA